MAFVYSPSHRAIRGMFIIKADFHEPNNLWRIDFLNFDWLEKFDFAAKYFVSQECSNAGWPLVMEIMEKSWNFFWSWKKSWNSKNLPNSYGKVMEVFYKDYSFFN